MTGFTTLTHGYLPMLNAGTASWQPSPHSTHLYTLGLLTSRHEIAVVTNDSENFREIQQQNGEWIVESHLPS